MTAVKTCNTPTAIPPPQLGFCLYSPSNKQKMPINHIPCLLNDYSFIIVCVYVDTQKYSCIFHVVYCPQYGYIVPHIHKCIKTNRVVLWMHYATYPLSIHEHTRLYGCNILLKYIQPCSIIWLKCASYP